MLAGCGLYLWPDSSKKPNLLRWTWVYPNRVRDTCAISHKRNRHRRHECTWKCIRVGHSLFVRKSKRQQGKRVIHTSKWCTLYVLQCTQAHIAKALDIDIGISSVFRQISNICSELFLSDPSPIIALPCKSVTNAFVEFCSNYWILSFASDCDYKI